MIPDEDAAAFFDLQRASYASSSRGLRGSWPERQSLDAAGLQAFLGRRRYCVLASARADGRAHAAPVVFVVAGAAFWFATVDGLRLRNLRVTPWASIVIMEGERDEDEDQQRGVQHTAVTAEGPVVLHEGDQFESAFEPLRTHWLARHTDPPGWAVALIELSPVRLFSHTAA